MALTAGVVPAMPDQACIGLVKKVGDVYLSAKGVYHVLPIEIEGKFSGRDGTFFFLFEPRWFHATFDPQVMLQEGKDGQTKYSLYRRMVNDASKPSVLQAILGDDFNAFAAEFDSLGEPDEKQIADVIRRNASAKDVGYVLNQRTDEDKELMEQYNIKYFFPVTDEALASMVEQSENHKRRRGPLVITWDVE
jgi:hypothetical protein